MSWNITHCSFLPSDKTSPTSHSHQSSHTIFSQHSAPQSTVAAMPTWKAILVTYCLSNPSLGHRVPWWWVTHAMEMMCVCDQVLGVFGKCSVCRDGDLMLWAKGTVMPLVNSSVDTILLTLMISYTSLTQRTWPVVKHTMRIKSLCVSNSPLVGLSIVSIELPVFTS